MWVAVMRDRDSYGPTEVWGPFTNEIEGWAFLVVLQSEEADGYYTGPDAYDRIRESDDFEVVRLLDPELDDEVESRVSQEGMH